MKVLVLGSTGQLGTDIVKKIKSVGISRTKNNISYFDKSKINSSINKLQPDIIINCIAYTDVQNAFKNRRNCMYLNASIPKLLSNICKKKRIILIHFSSDFVFSGKSKKAYLENSKGFPLNYYGKTKLKGDLNIISSGCKYFIFRISWLYNINFKNNFISKVKKKINNKLKFSLPEDEIGTPISSSLVAYYLKIFLLLLKKKDISKGIYNLTCRRYVSRYKLGITIAKMLDANHYIKPLVRISKKNDNSVLRPMNSRLNIKKIEKLLKIKIVSWEEDLKNNLKVKK